MLVGIDDSSVHLADTLATFFEPWRKMKVFRRWAAWFLLCFFSRWVLGRGRLIQTPYHHHHHHHHHHHRRTNGCLGGVCVQARRGVEGRRRRKESAFTLSINHPTRPPRSADFKSSHLPHLGFEVAKFQLQILLLGFSNIRKSKLCCLRCSQIMCCVFVFCPTCRCL